MLHDRRACQHADPQVVARHHVEHLGAERAHEVGDLHRVVAIEGGAPPHLAHLRVGLDDAVRTLGEQTQTKVTENPSKNMTREETQNSSDFQQIYYFQRAISAAL